MLHGRPEQGLGLRFFKRRGALAIHGRARNAAGDAAAVGRHRAVMGQRRLPQLDRHDGGHRPRLRQHRLWNLYIYWMRSLGYSAIQISQGAGATLADNYKTLTGKTTAFADLKAALSGKTVTSDNPFNSPAGSLASNPMARRPVRPGCGDPSGYMFLAQATQHVNYRGTNNHVAELWWNGIWHFNDFTAAASGAPNTASNPHGYIFIAQGTQHVNFLGPDDHVHELWWDSSGWHHNDLTNAAGAQRRR